MWWSWMTRCWVVTGLVLASPATQRHGRSGWQCVRAKSSTPGSDTVRGSRCVEEWQMEAPGKYKEQVSGGLSLSRVGNSLGKEGRRGIFAGKRATGCEQNRLEKWQHWAKAGGCPLQCSIKGTYIKKERKVGLKRASGLVALSLLCSLFPPGSGRPETQ
ncbi:hypothetical protein QBC37DRAFT_40649 [Rhypophila decipiens]|uniref:Uncharacterized protein n=1 Tax=Rhypophila decipiens TaxID=261697 RepID=A0AAN6YJA6_9PEZI|nr:hypothetical protein QBC37DRAFT_40649 [Rhypophila decipiens]